MPTALQARRRASEIRPKKAATRSDVLRQLPPHRDRRGLALRRLADRPDPPGPGEARCWPKPPLRAAAWLSGADCKSESALLQCCKKLGRLAALAPNTFTRVLGSEHPNDMAYRESICPFKCWGLFSYVGISCLTMSHAPSHSLSLSSAAGFLQKEQAQKATPMLGP